MHDERLHTAFIRVARAHWNHLAIADTTGTELTYGRTLIAAFALARVLGRRTAGETIVGTLLPASAGAVLANIALLISGRVPVNLNFTIGREALDIAVAQAGVKTILTSRKFLEKASLPEMPGMVFLEDVRTTIGALDKIRALVTAKAAPLSWLQRRLGPSHDGVPGLATIIFSSGSTAVPKGVMLTHANVLANVASLEQIFPMGPEDTFIGVLPLFHSFGFTGTFWFPLLRGSSVAYHPNPMDAKTVGDVAQKYKVTMLISAPTFVTSYVRRCTKEQFAHLRYAIVGAEKLREPLRREFRDKYGLDLLEGYGCTEMSPVVAVNYPDVTRGAVTEVNHKPGSVGKPIPGVLAKIVEVDSGADVGIGEEGLLLVKGDNVMRGYLDDPARTAEAIRNGWYVTGDIARIDEDGFIFITDRLFRFSKIGGEMVPHLRVEDAINRVLQETAAVVTSVPDSAKGERLVAFYAKPGITPQELWDKLGASDLPRLWIPKRESLVPIEAIPTLGTGKVDLRRVKELAAEIA